MRQGVPARCPYIRPKHTTQMRILLFVVTLCIAGAAEAQVKDSLVIELRSGEIVKIPFEKIETISFETKAGIQRSRPEALPKARTYPNPATRSTTIAFVLRSPKVVNVEITDLSGKAIRTIEKRCESGSQEITWDGLHDDGSMSLAGSYLYRLVIDGEIVSGKLNLTR